MAVNVTSDQSWRILPKESVKYPVIPKQKEYYIVQQGLSADAPAMSGLIKTGTPFILPDRATLPILQALSTTAQQPFGTSSRRTEANGR